MFNIERFKSVKFIGRGSFGDVYRYTVSTSGDGEKKGEEYKDVAVKKLGIAAETFDVKNCSEIQTMTSLNHVNVVRFLGYCKVEHQAAVVLELCAGDLQALIASQRIFSEDDVSFLIDQVCQGLAYLHQNDIIHRDIKPGNILIKCANEEDVDAFGSIKKLVLKISDFGLAMLLDESVTSATMTVVGTTFYMAPELRDAEGSQAHYSMRADVYSVGLVAYNLLRKDLQQLKSGTEGIGATVLRQESVHKTLFYGFLSACLQCEPSKRDTSTKLLQHPFFEKALFQNLNDEDLLAMRSTCTAIHYTRPNKMIVGTSAGKLIIFDRKAMTTFVKNLYETAILSICSNDGFIAVGSADLKAPVIILSKINLTVVKVLSSHALRVPCILMTDEFLVTLGDDEKMFVFSAPDWEQIAEETREGFARYQCATIRSNVLTVVDHRIVKQYKLANTTCEETVQVTCDEQLYSIAPDLTKDNVYWIGTLNGTLMKINLNKKKVTNILRIKEGHQVYQIKHLQEIVFCLLKDPRTKKFGPVTAYTAARHQRDIVNTDEMFGPLETSGEWLVHYNGEKLVPISLEIVRKKLPLNVQRMHFDNLRKSRLRVNETVQALHFSEPDLIVLGLRSGSLSVHKMSSDVLASAATKTIGSGNIFFIDSNEKFIASLHGKPPTRRIAFFSPSSIVDKAVTILRKDNFDLVHQLDVCSTIPYIHLSSKFLVISEDSRMPVYSTAGWKRVGTVTLESRYIKYCSSPDETSPELLLEKLDPYSFHSPSSLNEDVLTLVVPKAIEQYRLGIGRKGHTKWTSMTCVEVAGDEGEELTCITPDSSNAHYFWVGTDKGSIISVNLEKREVASKIKCGQKMKPARFRCLQELLLCVLTIDGTDDWMFVAYDMKDLRGSQSPAAAAPSFRHVSSMLNPATWSKVECYGNLGFVFFKDNELKAISIDKFRAVEITDVNKNINCTLI